MDKTTKMARVHSQLRSVIVLMLLNVLVNSYMYGHVGTVTSDFVGLLPDIERNEKRDNKQCLTP